jgi:peptide/nickel transport system permease protein
MLRFLIQRLAIFPIILLFANFIGYAFAFSTAPIVTTSNPYASKPGDLPPVLPAYWDYLQKAATGDFGETFTREPVLDNISRFGSASLGLIGISITLSILLGIPIGRMAVRRGRNGVMPWLTLTSTIGMALPSFYIAILLIGVFVLLSIYTTKSTELIPFQGFGWDAHLILPVLTLMIQPTVKIAQVSGGLLSDEMEKQYVTAAMSFGHPFQAIKGKFAFRNILAPVLLTIAASLRIMIAELIIIERLFNWPGVGRLISMILSAGSQSGDLLAPPMIAMILTILVGAFLAIDLLASFVNRLVDPRLRMDSEMSAQRR